MHVGHVVFSQSPRLSERQALGIDQEFYIDINVDENIYIINYYCELFTNKTSDEPSSPAVSSLAAL